MMQYDVASVVKSVNFGRSKTFLTYGNKKMEGLSWKHCMCMQGLGNSQLHASSHSSKITAGIVWRCRPFTQNVRESKPVPATPIGAAVCGLMNVIMTLLSVISSVHRHDHWWFCQRKVLTSCKFGMSKPPDSLCNERLVSRLQHWVKKFR